VRQRVFTERVDRVAEAAARAQLLETLVRRAVRDLADIGTTAQRVGQRRRLVRGQVLLQEDAQLP
jgi:hypothetical protein